MSRARNVVWMLLALAALTSATTATAAQGNVRADSTAVTDDGDLADTDSPFTPTASSRPRHTLESLVPELADAPYRLAPGPRPFLHRLAVTPSYGYLGAERLFSFRVAYNPNHWLGYEGSLGHNPAQSVHAVLHTVSAVFRRPLPGRFQPYGSVGYGMMMVFPGRSINADPVTKNALTFGGGLELYIRSDLALRADVTHATVFGRQQDRDGVVAFDYLQETIGLSFYRTIAP
jgi:hypothetical protein